jgi:hypothetical protein
MIVYRGKLKVSARSLHQCHFLYCKPHKDCLGLKLGIWCDKLEITALPMAQLLHVDTDGHRAGVHPKEELQGCSFPTPKSKFKKSIDFCRRDDIRHFT